MNIMVNPSAVLKVQLNPKMTAFFEELKKLDRQVEIAHHTDSSLPKAISFTFPKQNSILKQVVDAAKKAGVMKENSGGEFSILTNVMKREEFYCSNPRDQFVCFEYIPAFLWKKRFGVYKRGHKPSRRIP